MGEIFSIRNFNLYVGRYSRRPRRRTPEAETGWYLDSAVHEKLPIQALRNREIGDKWPPAWRAGRNARIAVAATLDSLKAWQAFRPHSAKTLLPRLSRAIPRVLASFQRQAVAADVTCIQDVLKIDPHTRTRILLAMADAVGRLSILKGDQPMLGSKIMHFLLPEFFPVWDTAWIKRTALANENVADASLRRWMSDAAINKLSDRPYAKPAIEYARYVALMMKDLAHTKRRDYHRIQEAYVRRSDVDEDVVWWHFYDLAPTLFEVCLLGKHNA
ncbi:MAG: hypothetical protein ACRD6R_08695 [Candidatus Polarisedimenticolia bacterium]